MALFGFVCVVGSLWRVWSLWDELAISVYIKYAVVISLAILPVLTFLNMVYAEKRYSRDKRDILDSYKQKQHE